MESLRQEVFLESGQCPEKALSQGPLILIHGGAGPADPQGKRADLAREAIKKVLQSTVKREELPPEARWLKDVRRTPTCLAELKALLGAVAMEKDPLFNAGIGGALQKDGRTRLSASFMCSSKRRFSAVINGQGYPYVSLMAFYLQWEKHSLRDGEGVKDLLDDLNISQQLLETPQRFRSWVNAVRKIQRPAPPITGSYGTIGCVCIDQSGHLAAVTSTGGVGLEPRGRVGDTPSIAGNYCGQKVAISCTGRGEEIVDLGLAVRVGSLVDGGVELNQAINQVLSEALERKMSLAAIAVAKSANGSAHWALGSTAPTFLWGRSCYEKLFVFR